MALKHNMSNVKIIAVLIHRLCGNYDEGHKANFTDKFKQLKQWLFGTYRTESIPQLAYVSLWKSWNNFKETQSEKKLSSCESYYEMPIMDLYPEIDRMYVSLKPIERPIYYLYKPNAQQQQQQQHSECFSEVVQPPSDFYGIPKPVPVNNGFLPINSVFEYMNRNSSSNNYISFPCEHCGDQLHTDTVSGALECSHFVHHGCLKESSYCPLCKINK